MIAIDLDDTLLRDDISISKRNIQTIQKAQQQGIQVVIATGRMFQAAQRYGQMLELGDLPMILYSGALIQTVESKTRLYHCPVDVEMARAIMEVAKEQGRFVQAYINDVLCVVERNRWIDCYEAIAGVTATVVGPALYHIDKAPTKLLAYGTRAELDEFITAGEKKCGDRMTFMRSKENFLEILHSGVDKSFALQQLCNHYGISMEATLAIGNSMNDLGMIKAAGLGVAVGNAEPEIKKAAQLVTATNNDDGVAEVIEKYVLNQS
jgi:hypothetical protein